MSPNTRSAAAAAAAAAPPFPEAQYDKEDKNSVRSKVRSSQTSISTMPF
jgi:hypothetical protein